MILNAIRVYLNLKDLAILILTILVIVSFVLSKIFKKGKDE